MPATPPPPIRHNEERHRFEAALDGHIARADYRIDGDVMRIYHTEVPFEFEGRGIAAALVRAALDYASERHLKVVPACSYVRSYMRRHPKTHALLATSAV